MVNTCYLNNTIVVLYVLLFNTTHSHDSNIVLIQTQLWSKLKNKHFDLIQNITVFIQINNNTDGQGYPALCRF